MGTKTKANKALTNKIYEQRDSYVKILCFLNRGFVDQFSKEGIDHVAIKN